jgi:outer membrane protein assembly factor BamB
MIHSLLTKVSTLLLAGGLIGGILLAAPRLAPPSASDWPDWRGPRRDGVSLEKGLPEKWSPGGENLAWKAPYGGRSAPVILGNRLFMQNATGRADTLQERILCLDADTGKMIWEHPFNVYSSDVPPHRIGWASPVADPATGNVYAIGANGTMLGLSNDGKLLWQRALVDEFGIWTTHGGRTPSPIIEGDLVIVSGIIEGWGETAVRRHRFLAFDKNNGQLIWQSTPGGRPYDTVYPTPIVAMINGVRQMIVGGADGAVYSIKPQTGELIWSYPISKRGINNCAVVKGTNVIAAHGEENLDTNEQGMIVSIDATGKGNLGKDHIKWSRLGFHGGYSSPVLDGDRIYQVDDSATLVAFNVNDGKELWKLNLGTIQKSSPVFGDGKLYVGTESGRFYILKPGSDKCEILDSDDLPGAEAESEQVTASVAISRGRVYLVSTAAVYCIGKKKTEALPPLAAEKDGAPPAGAAPSFVQVVPAEVVLKPGESVKFRARLFDAGGRFLREDTATWALDQLKGDLRDGQFTPAVDAGVQAGSIKATVGSITGAARIRVFPAPPMSEDFESIAPNGVPRGWVNADGKYLVRDLEGSKVLVKKADQPIFKRARAFMGPPNWSDYSVQADIRVTEKRRQMGDAGVVAQGYELVLFGNSQKLELESWQPETTRTVRTPFNWKADTWYRLKLQVENLPDGTARARGKVWPASETEPAAWMIEKIDRIPIKQGSPGLYADAPFEIFFDNVKVTANK